MINKRALIAAEKLKESKEEPKNDLYKLYKDNSEVFTCDVNIDGVDKTDKIIAKIVIETAGYEVSCKGKIINGRCIVSIPKLPFLVENSTGKIKLEINVDDTLFSPWTGTYIIKNRISANESKITEYKKNIKITVND